MAQPRLTHRTPVACACCYAQKPGVPHIDFAAAIEGGPVDPSNPRSPHVDWVVACADCIRSAHRLLPEVADERERHEQEIAALKAQLAEEREHSARLEAVVAGRPQREHVHPTVTPAEPKQRKSRYAPKDES